MKGRRTRGPGASPGQRMWTSSVAGKLATRRATEKSRIARRAMPKCGAKRKGDGQPCQMLALENGRCRLHGGLTPRGSQWHRVQYPKPGAPPEKAEKKLLEIEHRRKRQAARVAAMTPERRAKYEARSRALRPGTPAEREHIRRAREASKILSRPASVPVVTPQLALLRAKMDALNEEQARIEAWLAAQDTYAEQNTKENTDER